MLKVLALGPLERLARLNRFCHFDGKDREEDEKSMSEGRGPGAALRNMFWLHRSSHESDGTVRKHEEEIFEGRLWAELGSDDVEAHHPEKGLKDLESTTL